MRNVINLAVVNFKPAWADKTANLERIEDYAAAAGKRGADMIVFPEMALTGYDDEKEKSIPEKMQALNAEPIPGPSTQRLAQVAKKYGMYIILGMPQVTPAEVEKVYNSAAVIFPDGKILDYQKMHMPAGENNWGTHGSKPLVFDSPWGPVGIGICYDTYFFPELIRYSASKGARLFINCTACCHEAVTQKMIRTQVEASVLSNVVYIANANLTGLDKDSHFFGGSSIVGLDCSNRKIVYYAGHPFDCPEGEAPGLYLATIDLAIMDRYTELPLFETNYRIGKPDWRPEIYKEMLEDIVGDPSWQAKIK